MKCRANGTHWGRVVKTAIVGDGGEKGALSLCKKHDAVLRLGGSVRMRFKWVPAKFQIEAVGSAG